MANAPIVEWIIPVSSEERIQGVLVPAVAAAAKLALAKFGCVLLRELFDPDLIRGAGQEFLKRFAFSLDEMQLEALKPGPNPAMQVGTARFEVTLEMTGYFGMPNLFANQVLLNLLHPVLGERLRLSGFSAVVSYPGAPAQHIHRDHDPLFPGLALGPLLPAHALNAAVPLVDVDGETGPTAIWPGSHLWPTAQVPAGDSATAVESKCGDCLLIDYRTLHMGMPNRSARIRPVLYMVYARPWFFDEINHAHRPSLVMPLATYRSMSEPIRLLLERALSAQLRAQYFNSLAGAEQQPTPREGA